MTISPGDLPQDSRSRRTNGERRGAASFLIAQRNEILAHLLKQCRSAARWKLNLSLRARYRPAGRGVDPSSLQEGYSGLRRILILIYTGTGGPTRADPRREITDSEIRVSQRCVVVAIRKAGEMIFLTEECSFIAAARGFFVERRSENGKFTESKTYFSKSGEAKADEEMRKKTRMGSHLRYCVVDRPWAM